MERNRKRIAPAIFAVIALAMSVFILSSRSVQNKMLYYPDQHLPSGDYLTANEMLYWPAEGNGYRGFISARQTENIRGAIVIFHGNAGTASDRSYYLKPLTQLGYRVILAEYPGYGSRNGEPGEKTFVEDATETLRLVAAQYGAPIFLVGESLGCGVAAAAVRHSPVKIDGLILVTPWETLSSIAKEKVPWLPVKWFLRDKYDSAENLRNYTGRIAIAGAEMDELIPVRHAKNLYESIKEPAARRMFIIRKAGHNDWPDYVDQAWWKDVLDFVRG